MCSFKANHIPSAHIKGVIKVPQPKTKSSSANNLLFLGHLRTPTDTTFSHRLPTNNCGNRSIADSADIYSNLGILNAVEWNWFHLWGFSWLAGFNGHCLNTWVVSYSRHTVLKYCTMWYDSSSSKQCLLILGN